MIKPSLFSADIDNSFRSRGCKVSISIDTLNHDPDVDYKVLIQVEPPSVKNLIKPIIKHCPYFDLILAWHPDILRHCPNSRKFIFGDCWVELSTFRNDKKNEISFLTSSKYSTPGHLLRNEIFNLLSSTDTVNGFSIRSIKTPPRLETKNSIFENAKFSIIVENESCPNWITEKLIDCLSTRTIPIYYGCPNVGEYFEEEGILSFSNVEELKSILESLTLHTYDNLKDAVEINYVRSLQYHNFHQRVDKEIDKYVELHGTLIRN
tara:strand:+ start:488 stop:1279 length:792 start_codon:yes stop_codon:yes gene_type:complete